jgi:hypothetical protein
MRPSCLSGKITPLRFKGDLFPHNTPETHILNKVDLYTFLESEARSLQLDTKLRTNLNVKVTGSRSNTKPLPGSVYGFCARLNNNQKSSLFEESSSMGLCRHKTVEEFQPIESLGKDVFPLYWGKEQDQFSRFLAHMNGYEGNGATRLYKYKTLVDIEITYSSITVSEYGAFEYYLLRSYPPLLLTTTQT